jgi:hypothetical protein
MIYCLSGLEKSALNRADLGIWIAADWNWTICPVPLILNIEVVLQASEEREDLLK